MNNLSAEQQYLNLCNRVINEGYPTHNKRTGKVCLTTISDELTYDVGSGQFPILTTKQVFWKAAVAELQGYWMGLTNAEDFRKLGTKTWDANANKTPAWLNNPHRKGEDDMGKVYGAVAKDFGGIDLFDKVITNLKHGIDDRGEIITFWKPDEFDKGCLRPCMYEHHFSLLGDDLYLDSKQRSVDTPLGLPFNMIQVYVFLELMARFTNKKPKIAKHKLINIHMYSDQVDIMRNEQLTRTPLDITPRFEISDKIQCYEDLFRYRLVDECHLVGYEHQGKIVYPFSE